MSVLNIDTNSENFFIPVTTMTIIVKLNDCQINKGMTYYLLPWTMSEVPQNRGRSKCKLPHISEPGSIICLINNNSVRGIVKKDEVASFKNSVGIDISIKDKNLTLKISPNTVHITGAKSCLQAREGVKYLIEHLYNTQNILEEIREDKDHAKLCFDFIKSNIFGEPKITTFSFENYEIDVISEKEHLIKNEKEFLNNIPEDYNKNILNFFYSFTKDFMVFENFENKINLIIDKMCDNDIIAHKKIEIRSLEKAMVNFNFNLGFSIKRDKLVENITKFPGFYARYDNVKSHHVTVELYYGRDKEENDPACLEDNFERKYRHTFLVYMSGAVTHSGKKNMKKASKVFIERMNEIKAFISLGSESVKTPSS